MVLHFFVFRISCRHMEVIPDFPPHALFSVDGAGVSVSDKAHPVVRWHLCDRVIGSAGCATRKLAHNHRYAACAFPACSLAGTVGVVVESDLPRKLF